MVVWQKYAKFTNKVDDLPDKISYYYTYTLEYVCLDDVDVDT